MELLFIRYIPKNQYFLFLKIGERNGKLCGVLAQEVSDEERAAILKHRKLLDATSLPRRVQWLRDHCPNAYRMHYRQINQGNFQIISQHHL